MTDLPTGQRMKIVAVMPTMRWRNWPRIVQCFRSAALECPEVELVWMPVVTEKEHDRFPEWAYDMIFDLRFCLSFHTKTLVLTGDRSEQLQVTQKNNFALSHLRGQNCYIWFGSDDNLVPKSFCRRFREGWPAKIIVGCHKRGSGPGASGHGISDLVAAPASMRIGSVSGEQYIVHASVMESRDLAAGGCPDGQLMADLIKEMPQEFHFIPDFWIPFNALEAGRWKPGEVENILAV